MSDLVEENVILEGVEEEEEEIEPDYSYFPERTCWLCRRNGENGADINLIAGNGVFAVFMCGECQSRFRVR